MRRTLPASFRTAFVALLVGIVAAPDPLRADEPNPRPAPDAPDDAGHEIGEQGRLRTIANLRAKIRRAVRSPWVNRRRDEVMEWLGALEALGGPEAGIAALEAVWDRNPTVRDRAFALAERLHDERMLPVLDGLIEDKELRRDVDLRRRIAHAYAVIANPKSIGPLAGLIRSSEHEAVVDEAARALAVFSSVPIPARREPVRRMIDLYESTWTYMMSYRADHAVLRDLNAKRWDVFGRSLQSTLHAMTGQPWTRPVEWRRWWNDFKKATRWPPPPPEAGASSPPSPRRR